jgi:hypothetical protein
MNIEKQWNTQLSRKAHKEISEGMQDYMEEKSMQNIEGSREEYSDDKETEINEQIPHTLISTNKFIAKYGYDDVEQIYEFYKLAMERKKNSHDRVALEQDRFIYHFFENGSYDESFMYGDREKGFLLGAFKYNIFIPTHFAPKSLRAGYDLLKKLGDDQFTPSALMITDDLVKTIDKMDSWQSIDMTLVQQFMGNDIEKILVHNSHPDVKKLLYAFAYEYMQNKII